MKETKQHSSLIEYDFLSLVRSEEDKEVFLAVEPSSNKYKHVDPSLTRTDDRFDKILMCQKEKICFI